MISFRREIYFLNIKDKNNTSTSKMKGENWKIKIINKTRKFYFLYFLGSFNDFKMSFIIFLIKIRIAVILKNQDNA